MSKQRTAKEQKAIDDIVDAAVGMTQWTRDECINFISCLSAETPEELFEMVPNALELAREAEITVAGVDLMKRLGGVMDARIKDGKFSWRFHPDCKVKTDSAGNRIDIDFTPLGYADER